MKWHSGFNTVYADASTVCLDALVTAHFVAIVITLAFLVKEITAGTLWKLQGRPGPVTWLVLLIAPPIFGELLPINSVVWYVYITAIAVSIILVGRYHRFNGTLSPRTAGAHYVKSHPGENTMNRPLTPPPKKLPSQTSSRNGTPTAPTPSTPLDSDQRAKDLAALSPRAQAWFQKIAHLPANEQSQATDLMLRLSKRLRQKRANVAAREAAKKPNPSD